MFANQNSQCPSPKIIQVILNSSLKSQAIRFLTFETVSNLSFITNQMIEIGDWSAVTLPTDAMQSLVSTFYFKDTGVESTFFTRN